MRPLFVLRRLLHPRTTLHSSLGDVATNSQDVVSPTVYEDTRHCIREFTVYRPAFLHFSSPRFPMSLQTQTRSNHIDEFFARWPNFDFDSSQPITTEFSRLAAALRWEKDKMRDNRNALRGAVALQFEAYYGTDPSDIKAWKSMCLVIGIDPMDIPHNVEECRKVRCTL